MCFRYVKMGFVLVVIDAEKYLIFGRVGDEIIAVRQLPIGKVRQFQGASVVRDLKRTEENRK